MIVLLWWKDEGRCYIRHLRGDATGGQRGQVADGSKGQMTHYIQQRSKKYRGTQRPEP